MKRNEIIITKHMKKMEIRLTRAMQKGSLIAYCALWLHNKLVKRLNDEIQVQLIKMLGEGSSRAKKLLFLYRKNHSLCYAAWEEFARLNLAGNNKVGVLLEARQYWYLRSSRTSEDFANYIMGDMIDAARLRCAFWSLP